MTDKFLKFSIPILLAINVIGHSCLLAQDGIAKQDMTIEQNDTEGSATENNSSSAEEGINGLIIDNTLTIIGRDFYEYFSRYWSDQGLMDNYNLAVCEQPTARFGSRITVEWYGRELFQVFLTPTRSNIELSAKQAALAISRYFKMVEIQKLLFFNPDLAPDEF
jgi:curli production assembly/transport component CsgE